jgi:hypothetical protein
MMHLQPIPAERLVNLVPRLTTNESNIIYVLGVAPALISIIGTAIICLSWCLFRRLRNPSFAVRAANAMRVPTFEIVHTNLYQILRSWHGGRSPRFGSDPAAMSCSCQGGGDSHGYAATVLISTYGQPAIHARSLIMPCTAEAYERGVGAPKICIPAHTCLLRWAAGDLPRFGGVHGRPLLPAPPTT